MNEAPRLSVVIPCHNPHGGRLRRVLDGLRAQTLPAGRWEVVVIDNASMPALPADLGGTQEALRTVRRRSCRRLRRISLRCHTSHKGSDRARPGARARTHTQVDEAWAVLRAVEVQAAGRASAG